MSARRASTRVNAPGLPELPVFAHAALAGDSIHLSGMLGLTDDFAGVVDGGIGAGTTQALLFGARVELDCVAYRP